MYGKRILFFDPDTKTCKAAARALTATRSDVDFATNLEGMTTLLAAGTYDLIMAARDLEAPAKMLDLFDRIKAESPSTLFVMHATESTQDYMPVLLERPYLRNLIAKNEDPLEPEELIVTAEKLLRNDIFGLNKYLRWGVEPLSITLRESQRKADYVRQVTDYASRLGCNSRTVELVNGIADELVTNAIFNAPVDASGKAKYRHHKRSESLILDEDEAATLEFACDGDFMAVSISDPFGSLKQDTVIEYLNRCLVKGPKQISEDSGGAGLGLYRVFQSVSKFVINLEPGVRTEVISLVDLRLSMKQFRLATKSFHCFVLA
tara:strand:+ start:12613 stop:13572 length:960 start_codon:yes stop_codon:yes gene_type:complete